MKTFYNLYKQKIIISRTKPSVKSIATKVRNELVKCYGDEECLRETCLPSSRDLKKELIKYGYQATITQGVFRVDNPDTKAVSQMDVDGLTEEEIEDAKYNPLHYWVEVDNLIVDITADQFNNELEDEIMHPITIGTYSELDRYTPIRKDWI